MFQKLGIHQHLPRWDAHVSAKLFATHSTMIPAVCVRRAATAGVHLGLRLSRESETQKSRQRLAIARQAALGLHIRDPQHQLWLLLQGTLLLLSADTC